MRYKPFVFLLCSGDFRIFRRFGHNLTGKQHNTLVFSRFQWENGTIHSFFLCWRENDTIHLFFLYFCGKTVQYTRFCSQFLRENRTIHSYFCDVCGETEQYTRFLSISAGKRYNTRFFHYFCGETIQYTRFFAMFAGKRHNTLVFLCLFLRRNGTIHSFF